VTPRASVVVVAFGEEQELEACLDAVVADVGAGDEVLLVDNGFGGGRARLDRYAGTVRVVGDGSNLGFSGGCNLAAREATGEVLVFVNSDAIAQPGSVARLVTVALRQGVGIASGCLRLADRPDRLNSAGNPVHYLGVTWSGHYGEPVADHSDEIAVPTATGGFFAMRRALWNELGGFPAAYFTYYEDTELSLRCRLRGLEVVYVPSACADHDYEFSKNPAKMYFLERNRLLTVATVFPPRNLRAVLPMLLLTEPMFLLLAALQGWAGQKVRGWAWLWRHRREIAARRRMVQADRAIDEPAFARLLASRIEPKMMSSPPGMGIVNLVLASYWRAFAPRRP
jgi:GT2 family glycosyltransferase